jgi:glycosyltransferase A (GT-A) superfamily protein (DUF2064 family)
MNLFPTPSKVSPVAAKSPGTDRRKLLLGTGVAGAAAVAAHALNGGLSMVPAATVAAAKTGTAVDADGGYQVTEHVLRYYETAKV